MNNEEFEIIDKEIDENKEIREGLIKGFENERQRTKKIIEYYNKQNSDIVVTPELALSGYSPMDNLYSVDFQKEINNPEDLLGHLEAWCNLLAEISYLMPVPDGVASFRR